MTIGWTYHNFLEWIKNGCDENIAKNVVKLDCSYNNLTSIPESIGELKNLKELSCYNNKLTYLPDSIGNLRNLTTFDCSRNQLVSLPESIGDLQNLTTFYCYNNKLTSLPDSIGNLRTLTTFSCSDNQLVSLPVSIGKLRNLTTFHCSRNKLVSLPESIGELRNLKIFSCNSNQLVSLPESIGKLQNLTIFYCQNNKLVSLPISIIRLRKLQYFFKDVNPIEYIPPNLFRFLQNLGNRAGNSILNVYNDRQSVHNHNIQESIRKSIEYVISQRPSLTVDQLNESIVSNGVLSESTKRLLFEYSESKEIHSVLNITFGELLLNVYSLILENTHKDELLKILDSEIQDSECKCFTGRMSRLVNVLNGFVDGVKVEISEGEQIGNVIVMVKELLERSNEYSLEKHREMSERELLERGYEKEKIKEWLEYISE